MSNDALMIASAILNLQQESSIFKDFLFPLLSALLSVLAGYYIANKSFKKQEKLKTELDRVNSCNVFIVGVDGMLQTLASIKTIYNGKLNSHPVVRAMSIPKITTYIFPPPDASAIVFLAYANEYKDNHKFYEGWNNIPRFNAMLGNYAQVYEVTQRRNNLLESLSKLVTLEGDGTGVINLEEFTDENWRELRKLADVTETLISKVDGLIREVNSCIHNLHLAANKVINNDLIKGHASIVTYVNKDDDFKNLLKPTIEVDYSLLGDLLGITAEEARSTYKSGYENAPYPESD